jgi:hypothetical protein
MEKNFSSLVKQKMEKNEPSVLKKKMEKLFINLISSKGGES